jgi:hypothetical protein
LSYSGSTDAVIWEYEGPYLFKPGKGVKKHMRTYERPTLTPAGSFLQLTGVAGRGPKDVLGGKNLL